MCRLMKIMIFIILKQIILQECQFYCLLTWLPLLLNADYLVCLTWSQISFKVRTVDSCIGQFWKINLKWIYWRKKFTLNIVCSGLAMPSLILIRAKSTIVYSQIKHLKCSFLNNGKKCNDGIIKDSHYHSTENDRQNNSERHCWLCFHLYTIIQQDPSEPYFLNPLICNATEWRYKVIHFWYGMISQTL